MIRTYHLRIFILLVVFNYQGFTQEPEDAQVSSGTPDLFSDQTPLYLSLRESMKSLKQETNDSTYLEGALKFSQAAGESDSLEIRLRARGNYRRSHCYFAPLKLKFRKKDIRGSLFEGNKELKLVLPCLIGASSGDYVLKEYLAYKLYEVISPNYYRTRLVRMEYTEIKGKRERNHELLAFLVEDHSTLAKRLKGKRMERTLPPQMQDPISSIQNNLFQYFIGNTDFSVRLQHNQKLYYTDGRYVSIPYDFDMSGLVNAPYATVSNVQTLDVDIVDVTERVYKGYARDSTQMQQVRRQFLDSKPDLMRCLETIAPYFNDPRQYSEAATYLESFFEILSNDKKFEKEVLQMMRE